eukprot:7913704-Pyramimonas_sp.AAC.1
MHHSRVPEGVLRPRVIRPPEVSYGLPVCYIPREVLYSPGGVMRPPEVLAGGGSLARRYQQTETQKAKGGGHANATST